jgi:hypothetical protein
MKDPLYVRAPLAHTPAVHTPLAQRLPQAPQFEALERRSTSHPLPALPSQLAKPALQAATAHAPEAQAAVPLATTQRLPHPPQWLTSEPLLTSQPSPPVPLQSRNAPAQAAMEHAPPTQAAVALVKLHARPHEPQLATSDAMPASQPLPAAASQSRKPALQA